MKVKVNITFSDSLQLAFGRLARRPLIIFIVVIGIIMLVSSCMYFIHQPATGHPPLIRMLIGLYIVVFSPLFIYMRVRKFYFSNPRFGEEVVYLFDNEKMTLIGGSFDAEKYWSTTYKISEQKDCFMVYEDIKAINIVPKKSMTPEEIDHLRNFFKDLDVPRIKKQLR